MDSTTTATIEMVEKSAISGSMAFLILLWIGFSFLAFRLINRLIKMWFNKKISGRNLSQWIAFVELVFWTVTVVWIVFKVTSVYPLAGTLSLGVTFLLLWRWIRDFTSGLLMKYEGNILPGEWFLIDGTKHRINSLGLLKVQYENDKNESFLNGYYALSKREIVKPKDVSKLSRTKISIKLSNAGKPNEISEKLTLALMTMPWSPPHEVPQVNYRLNKDDIVIYDIVVNLPSANLASTVEEYLLKWLEGS